MFECTIVVFVHVSSAFTLERTVRFFMYCFYILLVSCMSNSFCFSFFAQIGSQKSFLLFIYMCGVAVVSTMMHHTDSWRDFSLPIP